MVDAAPRVSYIVARGSTARLPQSPIQCSFHEPLVDVGSAEVDAADDAHGTQAVVAEVKNNLRDVWSRVGDGLAVVGQCQSSLAVSRHAPSSPDDGAAF